MKKSFFAMALLLALVSSLPACSEDNPKVLLQTDLGDITVEIFLDEAPITAENFLTYVEDGFYNGTIFHRVIAGFMVQGGGYTFDFVEKETRDPIKNEASNSLQNTVGTLAMARTQDPDSASAQFFINLIHNTNLDYTEDNPGYAVFGQVIEGMDVVEAIVEQPQGQYRRFPNAPNEAIRILDAEIID